VEKKAQKTDAYQRNANLLLSETAYAESKPSLEILANDVRCTHGATVGPVSDEELWYLATRGIPKKQAESLIVEGFFKSALEFVDDESVKSAILQSVLHI
jgi:Fe-S cluster assembly protein SufD